MCGSWRSDEEMKVGKETWLEALEYHELSYPDDDGMLQYYKLLILYMINSPRYSETDICRNIFMMNYEMISYLEEIKEDQNSDCQIKIDRIIQELRKIANAKDIQIKYINIDPATININDYINYSFTVEEMLNSALDLEESKNMFNKELNNIYNEIVARVKDSQQILAFIRGKAGTGKRPRIDSLNHQLF